MLEAIKNIFKKKPKQKPLVVQNDKRTYEKKIDHSTDISFENEIQKELYEIRKSMKEAKE
jgi:hypothetical protein|tara:strand:+ start:116 stop:295 length:180 start_codon:yes stop_codon:yes gene_type:complete